jgi:Putative Ig domain
MQFYRLFRRACLGWCLLATSVLPAQQKSPSASPLALPAPTLPKVFVNTRFQYQLQARGGTPPYNWRLTEGTLPKGTELSWSGTLKGTPVETGEYHFTVAAGDNSVPPTELTEPLVLKVSAPLLARWERYPTVNGQRIEGSIKVSNDTDDDFDLTFVVLAVNEIGRAEAIGYQRFTLRKNTADFELPFGESVPHGSYQVHADVVGEVAATNSIHRARLETKGRIMVQQGP